MKPTTPTLINDRSPEGNTVELMGVTAGSTAPLSGEALTVAYREQSDLEHSPAHKHGSWMKSVMTAPCGNYRNQPQTIPYFTSAVCQESRSRCVGSETKPFPKEGDVSERNDFVSRELRAENSARAHHYHFEKHYSLNAIPLVS